MVQNDPNGRKWSKWSKMAGLTLSGPNVPARKTKSRGPKGLHLEVGARRAPRLLVPDIFLSQKWKIPISTVPLQLLHSALGKIKFISPGGRGYSEGVKNKYFYVFQLKPFRSSKPLTISGGSRNSSSLPSPICDTNAWQPCFRWWAFQPVLCMGLVRQFHPNILRLSDVVSLYTFFGHK